MKNMNKHLYQMIKFLIRFHLTDFTAVTTITELPNTLMQRIYLVLTNTQTGE